MQFDYAFRPEQVHDTALLVPDATVIGNVWIGAQSSVWYGAVLRGDCEEIRVGDRCNIQDGAILHADPGLPCTLGDQVTVGHGAIVHGATVASNVMIGIRAVILNGARLGEGCLIAANCLIPENSVIPPHSVVMGLPGKIVRQTDERDRQRLDHAWNHYVDAQTAFRLAEPPSI